MDERPPMERVVSTNVVMDVIMSYLKERDLLSCRKVSKFWNKAASSVLRKRSTMIKNISYGFQLRKLQECMKESSDFPFAGLQFDQPWRLSSAAAMVFFRNFGAKFTRLRLDTFLMIKLEKLVPFINLLPRLSILEVVWPENGSPPLGVDLMEPTAAQEDDKALKILSVRTIRITSNFYNSKVNKEVLGQVCTAASPSLRIECLNATEEVLEALESAGKLQALSVLNLVIDHDCINKDALRRVNKLLSIGSPTLTKLDLVVSDDGISCTGLINLLTSSQHTLKELSLAGIYPSQLSKESPVLAKLTTLSLTIDQSLEYVFQGRHGHKFPALMELKLDTIEYGFTSKFSDGFFIVPSLTRIDIKCFMDEDGIEGLAECFPNVIDIRLKHDLFDSEWDSDPTHIWSVEAFKLLEKLVIWGYTVQSSTRMNMNMDSFLTGIPINICENLREQPQQNLTNSLFNTILRGSPSILQLENLKELIICVKLEDSLKKLPEEPPLISMVSLWYALDMMPELKTRFVYEHGSPSRLFQKKDRDKAVTTLKGAFKHVQPYVALEPFFY